MNLMELFITIGADDQASEKISGITKAVGSGLKTAAKVGAAAVAAVSTGAVALGTAFANGAMQVAAYGDNIDKMSQKMGLSAQAYQEWDFILQHSGASIDSMQRGMMTLTQAAENGSDAFEALGLSQEDVASMSQDELFSAVIAGLQGVDDAGQRAVLAQKLLGGAAKELGPLLNTSAEDTEAMRQQVHELGGVMSDEAVKASAQFQDSLQNMKTALNGAKTQMLSQFLPSMSKVMDGLSALFSGDKGGIEMIANGVKEFTAQIQEIVPELIEAATAILEPVIGAIAEVLPDLIVTLLPVLIEGASKIVIALAEKIPDILGAIWTALGSVGQQLWSVLGGIFGNVGDWFREKFEAAKDAIRGVFQNIGEFFKSVWGDIKSAFTDLGTTIGDAISGAVKAGINGIIGAAENIVNGAINLINGAIELINSIPGVSIDTITPVNFPRLAIGMDRVPYNDFPALLHKDETVLTPREADEWRRGESSKVINFSPTINISGAVEDPRQTAEELMYEMKAILDREAAAYA